SDIPPLDIPDGNFLGALAPRKADAPPPIEMLLDEALDNPIGSEPLEKLASPEAKVLLLVDDITRQTPASLLLPGIFRRLERAGVARRNVKILIAAGTHSHMTPAELERKLGPETARNVPVFLHHWKEEDRLVRIGEMADGTPVRVNRMLGEADLVAGIGQIVPHRVMGFTGGASIVQPGVSGPEITGRTHWLSALYPGNAIMGVAENPVRQEVERIAKRAGLRFIVNVVMDSREQVVRVVAGDPVLAHRQGAGISRSIYGVPQSGPADIVFAESYPADYDLWQAAKGVYAAELAVRRSGVVVLVTPCFHGVSTEHPEVETLGYRAVAEVERMVETKKITDLVAAAHLAHVGRVIRDRALGIMVCHGIPPEVQQRIGFKPAHSPQEALELAFARVGRKAVAVAVLLQGGHVLPLPDSEQRSSEPVAAPASPGESMSG
ncbi:MAG: nickel-dependent lactate racemase, partial [Terriglobia bacterium]